MTLFSLRSLRRLRFLQGFTQIEILVIVFIIGIMAAIATPSFAGMVESANMKQTTVEIRTALQETQRQSIRKNKACEARVFIPAVTSQGSMVQGNCLTTGDRKLPPGIGLATNVLSAPNASESPGASASSKLYSALTIHRASLLDVVCHFPPICPPNDPSSGNSKGGSLARPVDKKVNVGFGPLGSAQFDIAIPTDNQKVEGHNAKFIAFRPSKLDGKKTCMVVSRSLGLTRIGSYEGSLDSVEITTSGKCQVASWAEQ